MKQNVFYNSIKDLRETLVSGKLSSEELTKLVLDRVKKEDGKYNSFVRLHEEYALNSAKDADRKIKKGEFKALTGVPVSVKDNFLIKGLESTCCSNVLKGYIPQYTSTVVKKLEDEGAVIIGKTNMDEFAMGGTTETSCYSTSLNPWNLERSPGGSSGGSSASVCAGFVPASIGTDTGGSIRQPASFCGLVGVKPTYGRVSRYGVIAYASSFDQVGPIVRNVRDAATLMSIISGRDENDSTSVSQSVPDFEAALDGDIKGVTIGLPREFFSNIDFDSEIQAAIDEVIKIYKKLGAKIKEVSIPHLPYAVASYYIMATSEASSNLARYDGIRYGFRSGEDSYIKTCSSSRGEGFGTEVKRRIFLGSFALSSGYYDAYYKKAAQVRRLVKEDCENVFKQCDVMLWPVTPMLPVKLGELMSDPLKMYLADVFTLTANLVGIPAVSFPCGFSKSKLPIGVQLCGNYFDEKKLLNLAYKYEEMTEWYKEKPLF